MNCTSCYICLVIVVELLQVLYSDLHLLSSVATLPVEHLLMGPAVCAEPCAFAAKLAVPPHSITQVRATLGSHQPLHGLTQVIATLGSHQPLHGISHIIHYSHTYP